MPCILGAPVPGLLVQNRMACFGESAVPVTPGFGVTPPPAYPPHPWRSVIWRGWGLRCVRGARGACGACGAGARGASRLVVLTWLVRLLSLPGPLGLLGLSVLSVQPSRQGVPPP
eukprot:gene12644-biopygen1929